MRIFIIKNSFIVFQSILQHDLYTFLKPLVERFLNASTSSTGDDNLLPRIFFYVPQKEEVIGCQVRALRRMTHQVLSGQKGADLRR